MGEPARTPEADGWVRIAARAREALTGTRDRLALAREGVGHMENATAEALWALSRVVIVHRRDGQPQDLRVALHELAESCETAATAGRGVDRVLAETVEQVRTLTATTGEDMATTGQDQVDQAGLPTRLARLEEELVRCRPLLEQAVVRLGSASEYARQAAPGQGRAAMAFPVDNVNRRLTVALEAGTTLRRELTHARDDTDRARGQVDAICQAARTRMATQRTHAPAAAGDHPASPGIGR